MLYRNFAIIVFLIFTGSPAIIRAQINRKALVQRHNVLVTKPDPLSSLSVGNGRFAFTVDITGLQTFPLAYEKGVPLGTQSEWGWHSFIDTAGYKREEYLKEYTLNGRKISYAVQSNAARSKAAADWFRQNPHRLQLGNLGFEIWKSDNTLATIHDIQNTKQELDLWTGEIKSSFAVEGVLVTVSTLCSQQQDVVSASVKSELIKSGRLKISLVFPYPTGEWTDAGTNYLRDEKHVSFIQKNSPVAAAIFHQLDETKYGVDLSYTAADIKLQSPHHFIITPSNGKTDFQFSCRFTPVVSAVMVPAYAAIKSDNQTAWKKFWTSGAAVDFSGSTDKRAAELERRIILSQYLIKIQETGSNPPQETGLTYNSWYGKPHMEMPYWHLAHYPYWGHADLLEKNMDWYFTAAAKGRELAKRQGFEGIRWQKMTDNTGDETPSSVGAFLIWNQPHLIYFAESLYRDDHSIATLNKYKELVFGTADFMASYPFYEKNKDRYILGKGVIPAQEVFPAEETFNPTYELVYWHWALDMAQQWRERLHLPRNKKWDEVLQKLSKLPVQDNKYLATESATDSYTNPRNKTDHPSVLMALGVMPATGQVDEAIMKNTFNWIWDNWTWEHTWGWDFPMVAMTAVRLGMPEKAVDALLMNIQTNTYLVNGHNYQNERLRLYLPGNGGVLSAIALMCAGYDGAKTVNPGIPKNSGWKVKWEGLKKLP